MTTVHPQLETGDVVTDRESDDQRATVVNLPRKQAKNWHVKSRGYLAADNPNYPADDPVVLVIWNSDLDEAFPYYSGVGFLSISAITERNVRFYAFPESRLQKVGERQTHMLPISQLHPHPCHSRNFVAADNEWFINDIKERGAPRYPPLVRVREESSGSEPVFEILNGHKRIWAAAVAGLDAVECQCLYCDREQGLRTWVNNHLDGYSEDVRDTAVTRIQTKWPDVAADLLDETHTATDSA